MSIVNTFYTFAPTMAQDIGFEWLPVLDEKPKQTEDASQIALEIIQTEMPGQDRFTISAVDRNGFPVVEVVSDNFVDAVRVYIAALSMHMQMIAASPEFIMVS